MVDRYRVLVTDFLGEGDIEERILGDIAELVMARARSEAELVAERALLEQADALMVYHDLERLGDSTFERTTRCRGVVRAGVGYNNVDLMATGRRGIVVCNVPDYGTEDVADHAIMLLLAVARQLLPCVMSTRRGEWDYGPALPTPRMRGKTLGIVGCGRIGAATALRAKALGLDVVIYDPLIPPGVEKALGVRRAFHLEELLEQSPFISLHCYLDATTRHLIDAAALARMPEGGILINTARGPVVHEAALLEALDAGRLLGAGLDVLEHEPPRDDRLAKHPRVVLTPHSAFYSIEGFQELRRKTAEEIRRILLGEPPRNPVNLAYLESPRTTVR
jgi:phosphoglycerate dehydrogenase-like enzyme